MLLRFPAIAAVFLLLAVSGCSDSGSRLMGKWRQVPEGRIYDFESGSQLTGSVNGRKVSGTWEVKENRGNTMLINLATGGGAGSDVTITFDGPDKFSLAENGQTLQFERWK